MLIKIHRHKGNEYDIIYNHILYAIKRSKNNNVTCAEIGTMQGLDMQRNRWKKTKQ